MNRLHWLVTVLFDERLVRWAPATQEACASLMRTINAPDRPPFGYWN